MELNIPLTTRGKAQSMEMKLRGTENEIWVKYLKVAHRHKAMSEEGWKNAIKEAGKKPAKAYS